MLESALPILAGMLGQASGGGGPAAAPPPGPPADFRVYVFASYGAVLLLILLFAVWSVLQTRKAEVKLDRLKERLEHAGVDIRKENS